MKDKKSIENFMAFIKKVSVKKENDIDIYMIDGKELTLHWLFIYWMDKL